MELPISARLPSTETGPIDSALELHGAGEAGSAAALPVAVSAPPAPIENSATLPVTELMLLRLNACG